MNAITRSAALCILAGFAAQAQAAVYYISFSGYGRVSINGGAESGPGLIQLQGYGDSANAVNRQSTPLFPFSYHVESPLDRLFFRGPGIEGEVSPPGVFVNSQAGGPSTQGASLGPTQLHWPFSIPARWPLSLVPFSGSAYAYQPAGPLTLTTGQVVRYRYEATALTLSGGPSLLPPLAAIPEPGTFALLIGGLAGLAVFRRGHRPPR